MQKQPYENFVSELYWTNTELGSYGKPVNESTQSIQQQLITERSRLYTTKTQGQSWYLNPTNLQSDRYLFLNESNPVQGQEFDSKTSDSGDLKSTIFVIIGSFLFLSVIHLATSQ